MSTLRGPTPAEIDRWAREIAKAESGPEYRALVDRLRRDPVGSRPILEALITHRSDEVALWATNVLRKVFGAASAPTLTSLARTARGLRRIDAFQQLEAIDPELLRGLLPELRTTFLKSPNPTMDARLVMFQLARLRDRQSADIFRRVAAHQNRAWYAHGMPMVLADYIDDPDSLARRIVAHDHDRMTWLTTAAGVLDAPGAEAAMANLAAAAPDETCRREATHGLELLAATRGGPARQWDFET